MSRLGTHHLEEGLFRSDLDILWLAGHIWPVGSPCGLQGQQWLRWGTRAALGVGIDAA